MQIEELIPFKSSTDQAIAPLYFPRISNSFYSSSSVNVVDKITGFALFGSKKACFKCLGNSFKVNPSKLVSISFVFSSLLLDFSVLLSFKLKTISFKSKMEVKNSQSRSSSY